MKLKPTEAPRRASISTHEAPMPREPPITKTCFPVKSIALLVSAPDTAGNSGLSV
jgi:hypothetical protein